MKNRKEQLQEWLEELNPFRRPKGEWFRFDPNGTGIGGYVTLCTEAHSYRISYSFDYLGCTGSCRKQLPGETWTRGSDLHDGKFTRETFDAIIRDIVAYELVKFAPLVVHESVAADVTGIETG